MDATMVHHCHDEGDHDEDTREQQRREQQYDLIQRIQLDLKRTLHLVEQQHLNASSPRPSSDSSSMTESFQHTRDNISNSQALVERCQRLWYQLMTATQAIATSWDNNGVTHRLLRERVARVCPAIMDNEDDPTTDTFIRKQPERDADSGHGTNDNDNNSSPDSTDRQERRAMESNLEQMALRMKQETALLFQAIREQNQMVITDLNKVHDDGMLVGHVTDVAKEVQRNNTQQSQYRFRTTWYTLFSLTGVFALTCLIILMAPKRSGPCLLFCPAASSSCSPFWSASSTGNSHQANCPTKTKVKEPMENVGRPLPHHGNHPSSSSSIKSDTCEGEKREDQHRRRSQQ